MVLIVGLGNPGAYYARTRHNIGFRVIDRLASGIYVTNWRLQCKALVGSADLSEEKVILAKPQTYMNRSGEAVKALLKCYGLANFDLILICDDLDLPPGQLRIRKKGSDGGHQGLKSVIEMIGSKEFIRIRVGIGRPAEPETDVTDWVLGRFSIGEEPVVEQVIEKAARAVQVVVTDGVEKAMNWFN
jgi:PTH1 family peptidyl-tRNA hydrolase